MSFFVELPIDSYPTNVVPEHAPRSDADLQVARMSMWFAQLAYETHVPSTIEGVAEKWRLTSIHSFTKRRGTNEIRGVVGSREGLRVLAFSGLDPAVWRDATTAIAFAPSQQDTHTGFQSATESLAQWIQAMLLNATVSDETFIITGHSMGAAFAALVAERCLELRRPPDAIYLFGSPRVGRARFRQRYQAKLGSRTFRFTHGNDVVVKTPPAFLGFDHVGRSYVCGSGEVFDLNDHTSTATGSSSALPEFLPRTLRVLYSASPSPLRDHYPAMYCNAFS